MLWSICMGSSSVLEFKQREAWIPALSLSFPSCISQPIPALKYIPTLPWSAQFIVISRVREQTQVSVINCPVQKHKSANMSLRTTHFIFDRYYRLLGKPNQPFFLFLTLWLTRCPLQTDCKPDCWALSGGEGECSHLWLLCDRRRELEAAVWVGKQTQRWVPWRQGQPFQW